MTAAGVSTRDTSHRLQFRKQPDAEPIPGYRLIEPIGSGGFGEVWKCEAPGGLLKAIKFVFGGLNACEEGEAPAEEELRAIQRVKAIRHPFLLSMERVEYLGGELVIVLELADKSLHDLLGEYQAAGKDGLPRSELLAYLRETAEALDLMNHQHDLQHLDIKPRNLFLVSNHVKVGDFGLVNSLGWGETNRQPTPHLGAITPLYASPEVFQGTISRFSDQYSLALVYQELLTGRLPFTGKNARQLLLQRLQSEPDLGTLPVADRPAVARALARDPQARFPSCADFVRALAGEPNGPITVAPAAPDRTAGVAPRPGGAPNERGEGEGSKDTVVLGAGKTDTVFTRPLAPATGEAVAGHRLLDCLCRTPLTEVWKARAADGQERLVKIIYGVAGRPDRAEGEGLARLQALQHPALLPSEILQSTPGRLVLASDLTEKTLRDRLQQCQAQGLPGIPRTELLDYLRDAAEALHSLYQRHALQHLGLNPRNLLLDSGRILISDFGLAQLLWLPAGQPISKLNARYAAPELFDKSIHASCDQYSLALIYHEMLTGCHARRGGSYPPAAGAQAADLFDLSRLPTAERAIIARALDGAPERRWPDCVALVRALEAPAEVRESDDLGAPPAPQSGPVTLTAGADDVLQTRLNVSLPPGVIRERLDSFRQQWNGQVVRDDATNFVFQMKTPRSVWQRWLGRQPGLEVHTRLMVPPTAAPAPTEVAVEIKPHGCGRKQSAELLKVIGPLVLEGVRACLQANPKRRAQERFVWRHPLQLRCIQPDGSAGEAIECQGKDISLNGIGFYLPRELPMAAQVRLDLPQTPQTPAMTVPVRIVRVQGGGDGWFEVGAILLPPTSANDAG